MLPGRNSAFRSGFGSVWGPKSKVVGPQTGPKLPRPSAQALLDWFSKIHCRLRVQNRSSPARKAYRVARKHNLLNLLSTIITGLASRTVAEHGPAMARPWPDHGPPPSNGPGPEEGARNSKVLGVAAPLSGSGPLDGGGGVGVNLPNSGTRLEAISSEQ